MRPYGFKKAALRELVFAALMIPFLFVGIGFAFTILDAWLFMRALKQHPVATYQRDSDRIRTGGVAARKEPVTSPAGKPGVAWVAAVGYMAKHKRGTSFEPLCVRADIRDVQLDGALTWRLDFADPAAPAAVPPATSMRHEQLPQIDLGEMAAPEAPGVPAPMRALCKDSLDRPESELVYREAVLAPGTSVQVIGCTKTAGLVVPCADGVDMVTIGSVEARVTQARADMPVMLLFGGFWNLLIVGAAIGGILSTRLVRARMSVAEAVRNVG